MRARLNVMHRRLIAFVLVVAAGALVATAATAAPKSKQGFRHVLAAKLGAQLDKPADDVLAALKATAKATKPTASERAERKRATREQRRERAASTKQAWAKSMAEELSVQPEAVNAAVKALVKERLDSLVEDGWLTAEQRDKRLARGTFGIRALRVGR
jgi:hypothetical protein